MWAIPTGTSSALKKNQVKSPSIWSRAPNSVWIRQSGRIGNRGVTIPLPKIVKIEPKTIDCIFIGYAHNNTTYQFLVHESNIQDIHKNKIMESRNASFFEDVFLCESRDEPSSPKRVLETINENS